MQVKNLHLIRIQYIYIYILLFEAILLLFQARYRTVPYLNIRTYFEETKKLHLIRIQYIYYYLKQFSYYSKPDTVLCHTLPSEYISKNLRSYYAWSAFNIWLFQVPFLLFQARYRTAPYHTLPSEYAMYFLFRKRGKITSNGTAPYLLIQGRFNFDWWFLFPPLIVRYC